MIIVIGTAFSTPDTHEAMLALSREHVARSRAEPGCIAHNVHLDCEDETRLVFVEYWEDMAALQAHFAVPESREFASEMGKLAATRPEIKVYDSTEISLA